MPIHDQLYRGIIKALDMRFVYVDCPKTAQEIILRHNCDPISAHVLARAVGTAALMSALLTEDEKYTLRWNYQGALSCVLADCDANAHIRALVRPTDLSQHVQNEGDIFGKDGTMTVIKSTATQILNSGSTQAGLLDVVEDLAFHMSTSDQIETAMAVIPAFTANPDTPVQSLRGIMLQALPDCDLQRFDRIRNRLASPEIRRLLMAPIVQDNLFERLVMELTNGEEADASFTLEATATPSFFCNCTKARMIEVLASLKKQDIEDAFNESGAIRMSCQFCNTVHTISREDLSESAKP